METENCEKHLERRGNFFLLCDIIDINDKKIGFDFILKIINFLLKGFFFISVIGKKTAIRKKKT
jgi:hypothetical protein